MQAGVLLVANTRQAGVGQLTNTSAPTNSVAPDRLDNAQVAELVDALASGASDRKVVKVRVLSWAPLLAHARQKAPHWRRLREVVLLPKPAGRISRKPSNGDPKK